MFARSGGIPFSQTLPMDSAASVPARGVYVRRLTATNFRNYDYVRLDLPESPIVLTGRNGTGKTNLMEAVSFLAPGKGMRQARFSDVLPTTGGTNWAVSAVLEKGGEEIEVGTAFEPETGKRSEKRRIHVNGAAIKNQNGLDDVCQAVWLTPAMDRLFSGDPAGRRRFWDRLVQAFYPEHARSCAAYMQALRQWNALLREGRTDDAWLTALEKTLAKYGAKASLARRNLLTVLQNAPKNDDFPSAELALTGGLEADLRGKTEDEAAAFIADWFKQARGTCAETGVAGGVHTIDLAAVHTQKNMPASSCSTGEQKALLVAVLLSHIRALAAAKGTLPLILFDEAAAHLDSKRLEKLLEQLKDFKTQVWVSGTDNADFDAWKETAHFVAVEDLFKGASALAAAS